MAGLEGNLDRENIENEAGHLRVCGWCQGILGKDNNVVLTMNDNPESYNALIKKYKENLNITHSICNECDRTY